MIWRSNFNLNLISFLKITNPSSYQLKLFIYLFHSFFSISVDLLQMLEFNVSVRFPAASLFTVILALCGKYENVSLKSPSPNSSYSTKIRNNENIWQSQNVQRTPAKKINPRRVRISNMHIQWANPSCSSYVTHRMVEKKSNRCIESPIAKAQWKQ